MSKKKTTEPIYTYKLEIIPTYEPTKWEAGTWEIDKETKQAHFTGKAIHKHIGYQAVIIAYLNGKKLGIAQGLGGIFPSAEKAEEHVKHYYEYIKVGNMFKPAYQAFLTGEIVA